MNLVIALLAGYCISSAAMAFAQEPRHEEARPSGTAVAIVGTEHVTEEALRETAGNKLLALESQVYRTERQLLDGLIAKRLFEMAAREAGQPPEEYTNHELLARTTPVADEEVNAIYEGSKGLVGGSEAAAKATIRANLEQGRAAQARQRLVRELRGRYPVRILLRAPRVNVPPSDGPARGPATAPVRIVVFSDFQCPYCAQVASTLFEVVRRSGDHVRLEYRHFPLPMHREAGPAAEAAECMMDQGRFWEMHDALFANQKKLTREDLLAHATNVKGDPAALTECLDSGRRSSRVADDRRMGETLGVAGTPAMFVNGRLVPGAVPLQDLLDIVEEEASAANLVATGAATTGNR